MSALDSTIKEPDFTELFNTVRGLISLPEAELLYRLASEVPAGGKIIEIGSYQGRSTIALALGAKVNGAVVYAIDAHHDCTDGETVYGMKDNQEYYHHIAYFQVGNIVRTINLASRSIGALYLTHLLWIDGSHEYRDVKWDFEEFSRMVTPSGKIALHDTAGYHEGVTRVLHEVLAAGRWQQVEQVDAIAVLERVK